MESDMKYPVYNKGTTVYSENPWNYICHICPEKRKNSLEDHLKDDNHLQRLKYYTQFFTNTGSVLHCKLCLKLINLSQVIEHAFNHKLIPWYVPDNSPVILFKNFISQREHQYFCHLCNVKLPFWFSVEHHIEDSHHQTLKRDKIDEVIFKNLSLTISCYELAINNSIFMKSSECLSCSLCDCEVKTSYEEIVNHIEKKSHIKNQEKNIEALESTAICHSPSRYRTNSEIPHDPSITVTECNNNSKDYNCIMVTPVSHYKLNHSNPSVNSSKSCEGITDENDKEDDNNVGNDGKSVSAVTQGLSDPNPEEYTSTSLSTSNSMSPEKSFHSTLSSLSTSLGESSLGSDKLLDTIIEGEKSSLDNCEKMPRDRAEEREFPPLGEEVFLTECKFCHQEILGGPETLSDHINSRGHKEKREVWMEFSCFYDNSGTQEDPKFNENEEIKYFIIENPVQVAEDMIRVVEIPKGATKSEWKSFYWCYSCNFKSSEGESPVGHLNSSFHSGKSKKPEMIELSSPSTSTFQLEDEGLPRSGELANAEVNSGSNRIEIRQDLAEERSYHLPEKLIKLRNVEKFWCTICYVGGFLEAASDHASKKRHLDKLERWRKRELWMNPKKVLEPSPPESSQGDPSTQCLISNFHLGNRVDTVPSSVEPEANRKILPQSIRNVPCEICNCMIPGGNWNVNIHRNTKEHLENEARVKIPFKSSNEKETRACSPQLPRGFTLSDIPSDNIVQYHYIGHIIDSIECKICGSKIRGTFQTSVIFEYLKHTMSKEHRDNELKFIDGWTLSEVNSASLSKTKPKKKERKKVKSQKSMKELISCPICGEKFEYEKGLHGHMTSHFWKRFLKVPLIDIKSKFSDKVPIIDQNRDQSEIEGEQSTESTEDDLEFEDEKSIEKERRLVVLPDHLSIRPLDIATNDKLKIYDVDRQKIENVELGILLSFTIDKDKIYCIVCRENVENSLQNFYEHLCSVIHLDYLQEMIEDHKKFRHYPDQLSDLGLAHEYMQEVSKDDVWCHACRVSIKNVSINLNKHINDPAHTEKWSSLGGNAKEWFNTILSRMDPDFYSTWRYWCVPCKMHWNVEMEFRQHLNGKLHKKKIKGFKNSSMMFDYCALCATLWYGFLKTYSYHSTCKMHKNQAVHSCYYLVNKIPNSAEKLLHRCEKKIEEILTNVDSRRVRDKKMEDQLMRDLEEICKEKYPSVKAYPSGSRMSGLAGRNSDLDIFLDCSIKKYPVYAGRSKEIFICMENIRKFLEKDSQNWHVNHEFRNCKIPIIKATHRPTGIECDISFSNGLTVQNTKMIKAYCESYPHARKLIIFVKNWMGHCELNGVNGIKSYGIAWLVIYFLQVKMILPTVSELIERRQESRIIGGWETGVSTDFQSRATDESFKELLMQFFRFYEDFDYRNYVICPLVGRAVGKKDFQRPTLLPEAMKPYLNYLKGIDDPEPFRVDSVMCLQDPFDLSHNISKSVQKFMVHRFKTLCSLSAQFLENND